MVVPVSGGSLRAAPHLHKTGAPFTQPPCQQTATTKVCSHRIIQSVRRVQRLRFFCQIKRRRGRQLHPRRQFVRRNPRLQAAVIRTLLRMTLVDLPQQRQPVAIGSPTGKRESLIRKQIRHRLPGGRVNHGALMQGRQKTGRERALLVVRQAPGIRQHNKRRQIVHQPPERIRRPRPRHGKPGRTKPVFIM